MGPHSPLFLFPPWEGPPTSSFSELYHLVARGDAGTAPLNHSNESKFVFFKNSNRVLGLFLYKPGLLQRLSHLGGICPSQCFPGTPGPQLREVAASLQAPASSTACTGVCLSITQFTSDKTPLRSLSVWCWSHSSHRGTFVHG